MDYVKKNGTSKSVSYVRGVSVDAVGATVADAGGDVLMSGGYDDSRPVTAAQVAAIVREVMSQIRVYVLEADITDAQNAVKDAVDQSYF